MEQNKLWCEKYRPQTFEEIIGNKFIIEQLSKINKIENLPHLLFSGSAGVGKTTTALVLAKKFFNKEELFMNFLELNASDDRGIDIIRNKVKDFAKTVGLTTTRKIIFLDEFDATTQDAQTALRRVMEEYSNRCVFILACNYINKIIEPIKSRCSVYSFSPITPQDMQKRIKEIVNKENVLIEDDALDLLLKISCGDFRKVLNTLQSLSFLERKIKTEDIMKTQVDFKEFFETTSFIKKRKIIQDLLDGGINERELLKQIREWLINNEKYLKSEILYELMMTDYRIILGVDKYLAFDGLLVRIC